MSLAIAGAQEGTAQMFDEEEGHKTACEGSFDQQQWARDSALAVFAGNSQQTRTTLETFLSFARLDGALPMRVERNRHALSFVLGWTRGTYFDVVTRSAPYPVYDDSFAATPARDTATSLIIAFAECHRQMCNDQPASAHFFLVTHITTLEKALAREEQFIAEDGLITGAPLQDWLDCIKREPKLCFINLLMCQAYRAMGYLFDKLKDPSKCWLYRRKACRLNRAIQKHFWNEGGYFQAGVADTRFDSMANCFAILFSHDVTMMQSIVRNAEQKVRAQSGFIKTVDREYPHSQLRLHFRMIGFTDYGHVWLYPVSAHLYMLARLHLAKQLGDSAEGLVFQVQQDLQAISAVHEQVGGLYEVIDPQTMTPAEHRVCGVTLFGSSKGFLASWATLIAVHRELSGLQA